MNKIFKNKTIIIKSLTINKKEILLRIIFTFLVFMWMVLVFMLSAQNGEESENLSTKFIEKILMIKDNINLRTIETSSNTLDNEDSLKQNEKQREYLSIRVSKLQKVVRKIAHYMLYTLGGFLIYCMATSYSKTQKITKNKVIFSVAFGVCYAISDEIHQIFTEERSPKIFDVFIDSCGIIMGIILAILVIKIIKTITNCIMEKGKELDD